jgi:hypothetical protein
VRDFSGNHHTKHTQEKSKMGKNRPPKRPIQPIPQPIEIDYVIRDDNSENYDGGNTITSQSPPLVVKLVNLTVTTLPSLKVSSLVQIRLGQSPIHVTDATSGLSIGDVDAIDAPNVQARGASSALIATLNVSQAVVTIKIF